MHRQFPAERQASGDRRGKRAAGSVSLPRVDPRHAELVKPTPVEQKVHYLRSRSLRHGPRTEVFPPRVSTRDDDGRRPHAVNPPRGLSRTVT